MSNPFEGFEREQLALGVKFLTFEIPQCPKCYSFDFDIGGPVTTPPTFLQLEHIHTWQNARYESDRYFCHECQSFWDVVKVNELGESKP